MAVRPEGPTKPHPRDLNVDRTIQTWESWVDEAIRESRERGDFDDLPGTGKPLQLERYPFAGDRELGFHVLKNAEMLPRWMELNREVSRSLAALDHFCDQSVERLARLTTRVSRQEGIGETMSREHRILRLLRGNARCRSYIRPHGGRAAADRDRQHTRRQYLERAAKVDKLIQEYNRALPAEIRRLERTRLLPEQAAARFDAVCPRVESEGANSSK